MTNKEKLQYILDHTCFMDDAEIHDKCNTYLEDLIEEESRKEITSGDQDNPDI